MGNVDLKNRQRFDLPALQGVVVLGVEDGSPAQRAGLQPGDVIQGVNGRVVRDLASWEKAMSQASGKNLVLLVWREGRTTFVPLKAR